MTTDQQPERRERNGRGGATRLMWAAGLVVALGAAVLTGHGLIEVARGSTVPVEIAWLYPVITDGLALVAYAATTRLAGAGRRYAWTVVVVAAGLSAIAQATYLKAGSGPAAPWLRFAVGAWPAIAAAVTAHLLFLIGTTRERGTGVPQPVSATGVPDCAPSGSGHGRGVQSARPVRLDRPKVARAVEGPAVNGRGGGERIDPEGSQDRVVRGVQPVQVDHVRVSGGVQSCTPSPTDELAAEEPSQDRVVRLATGVQDDLVHPSEGVQRCTPDLTAESVAEGRSEDRVGRGVPPGVQGVQVDHSGVQSWDSANGSVDQQPGGGVSQLGRVLGLGPALTPGDRAVMVAQLHHRRSGAWPSVRELAGLADVSRGTAESALRQLRGRSNGAHTEADQPTPGAEK